MMDTLGNVKPINTTNDCDEAYKFAAKYAKDHQVIFNEQLMLLSEKIVITCEHNKSWYLATVCSGKLHIQESFAWQKIPTDENFVKQFARVWAASHSLAFEESFHIVI